MSLLARIESFLTFVASQCLPGRADASPTPFDYALTVTIILLVFYAAYELLRGLTRPDNAATKAIKTNILRE